MSTDQHVPGASGSGAFAPYALVLALVPAGLLALLPSAGCAADVASETVAESPADSASARVPIDERLAAERERFVAAREALAVGDRARFLKLEAQLIDYPLHDYLVYARLRERLRRERPTAADLAAIEAFVEASGDEALARRLVRTLQDRLAETERWEDFLALRGTRHASRMPCTTLLAREATAPPTAFDEETLALWIDPTPLSKDCAAALEALERRASVPVTALWERIHAAMKADRPEHAESVLGHLSTRDRRPVAAWIAALEDPGSYLRSGALASDSSLNRRILADLVYAWSSADTEAAMIHWLEVRGDYAFSADGRRETDRALAMRAAYRRMPEAGDWLDVVETRSDDLELQEWRVRVALLAGDWDEVRRNIARLPPREQKEDHWAYWEARALEKAGETTAARAIYARLAELQSWHGFLSAERIGRPHAIEDIPIVPVDGTLERLAAEPALVRAREYHHVGLGHEGRREWNDWLADRGSGEAAAAAALAAAWGLGDRAIFSAGRSGELGKRALALRFPVLHAETVTAAAAEQRLEPAWVYGVMRRESAYIADIRSSAGAIGLMQLMPTTATYVAKLRGEADWRGDLTDPETNIAFGTFYLRHVLDRFDDHVVLATASYNAGPSRVAKWLPDDASMEADRWIDTIPYTETRRYVRAVLAYAAIYHERLTGEGFELGERLRPVPPPDGGEEEDAASKEGVLPETASG